MAPRGLILLRMVMPGRRSFLRALAAGAGLALVSGRGGAESRGGAAPPARRGLALATRPWTGDLSGMVERRMIRVLVPFSRSLYFVDGGRERGLTAELVRDFERHINRTLRTGKRPITVYVIPSTRDQIFDRLVGGLGDIATGNLTITAQRAERVDFDQSGAFPPVDEILVTGPRANPVATLADLAGRRVHVRPSSSYRESLEALDARFRREGLAPLDIVPVPDPLEDEDMMEMLAAGIFEAIVVDDWKARLWAPVLPALRLHPGIVLRAGGRIGWAFRKDSPELAAAISGFMTAPAQARDSAAGRLAAYHRRGAVLRDPTDAADRERFAAAVTLFERYGARYGFEPLLLLAQGYQESRLDQAARSPVGAIGVMQLMPDTGAAMRVGDIRKIEANIHAGAKYLDQLMTRHFAGAQFTEVDRALFAFAAYNAGPARIARMRPLAAARGLDPDRWFNHVEIVVAEKIGAEPVRYVRNIYKYYAAYAILAQVEAARRRALDAVRGGG